MNEIGFNTYNDSVSHKYILKNIIISINRFNIFEVFVLNTEENNILSEI